MEKMVNNNKEGLSGVNCSICNLSSAVLSSSLEGSNLTNYRTFCKLIANDFLENSFICEDCKLNLRGALESSEEVLKARNCISKELKLFQNKLDLALLQLQAIGDRAPGGTFQNGVKTVTSKLLTLKDTINITLRVSSELSSMDLTISAELASTRESVASQSNGKLAVVDPEGPNPPDEPSSTEVGDADGCTIIRTFSVKEKPFEEEDDVNGKSSGACLSPYQVTNATNEITIGPVFQTKFELSGEVAPTDTEEVHTCPNTTEAEAVPVAILKFEPPKVTRVLRRRRIYHSSDNPPQIIPISPEARTLAMASGSDAGSNIPIEIDLEPQSPLNENGKTGRTEKSPRTMPTAILGGKTLRVLLERVTLPKTTNPPPVVPNTSPGTGPTNPPEVDLVPQPQQSETPNQNRGRKRKAPQTKQNAIRGGKRRRVLESDASPTRNPPPTLSISKEEIKIISEQLYKAVEKTDLDTLKALISKEEVLQVIRYSTYVKEGIRGATCQKVSKLIITCVEFSLTADENKLLKKKEIILCLTNANEALLGPLKNKQNSHASYKYSPLLCFDVHADLILFLMDLGADPGIESTAIWNNILSYLARQIPKVPEADKLVYFQKVLNILEKVIEEQTEWHQPGLLPSFMDRQMPPKVFDLLKKLNSNFNAVDSNGHSLLSKMLQYRAEYRIETIKKFVECGASLAWKSQKKWESLVHLAVMIGHLDAVKYFLEKNPELAKAQDRVGLSPLDYLLLYRNRKVPIDNCVEIANLLFEFGGKFNSNEFLLHQVAEKVNNDPNGLNTELLFRLGFRVNQPDHLRNLPLHLACASLEKKCPQNPPPNKELLELVEKDFGEYHQRAQIIQGFKGRQRQLAEGLWTIRTLVYFGADVTAKNLKGETPADIISRLGIPEYVKNAAKLCL